MQSRNILSKNPLYRSFSESPCLRVNTMYLFKGSFAARCGGQTRDPHGREEEAGAQVQGQPQQPRKTLPLTCKSRAWERAQSLTCLLHNTRGPEFECGRAYLKSQCWGGRIPKACWSAIGKTPNVRLTSTQVCSPICTYIQTPQMYPEIKEPGKLCYQFRTSSFVSP